MPKPRIKSAASITKKAMNSRKRKPSIKAARARNKIKRAGALSKSARRAGIAASKGKRLASFIKKKLASLPAKKKVTKKVVKKTVKKTKKALPSVKNLTPSQRSRLEALRKREKEIHAKSKPSVSVGAKVDHIPPRAFSGATAKTKKMTAKEKRQVMTIKDSVVNKKW